MVVTDVSAHPASPRARPRHRSRLVAAATAAVAAALLIWWLLPAGPPGPPPASLGTTFDKTLPAAVLDAPLVDQSGASRPLRSFAGRILVLVPFLTSCQEQCPITTGALLEMSRDVKAAGLGAQVVFAEATVDPGRDVPTRLAAYARVTGTSWALLTGSPATMASVWRAFGVFTQRVPEGSPPGIDWQSGRPYTYDVNHSDGFVLLDARQHERFATIAGADLQGRRLSRPLQAMLDATGRSNLAHPQRGSWTVPQALGALAWLAGQPIPAR